MTPQYARSEKGKRAYGEKPVNKGTRVSTIGALSDKKVLTAFSFTGAFDSAVFLLFIQQFLLPFLCAGKAVVMDNSSVHKVKYIIEIIKNTGAEVIFLPPYSPELNPIERVWSEIKNFIRKCKPRTTDSLYDSIRNALNCITAAV